jgi:hypothetical protein
MRNDFREHVLEHSAKGTTWKNTKYLKKIMGANGKYIYFYTQAQLDAYNKQTSGSMNVLSNNARENVKKGAMDQLSMQKLAQGGMIAPGKTLAQKTKNLNSAISKGSKLIQETLAKQSKKSSKSGSGSSKKSTSIAGKSKGSSGSSSKSSKAAGSKAASSKAAKATKEKSTAEKSTKQETQKQVRAFDSAAAMKLMYGITDDKINKYDSKEKMLENMKKYDDNSYGYLTAKNTTYKWEKTDGNVKLIDMNTDKEISIDEQLKDVSSIQEFRTDNIKRKSKYRK